MKSSPSGSSSLLGVRRGQNLAAGGRQLRQRYPRPWLRRFFLRLGVDGRILEPERQVAGTGALAVRRCRLALAFAAAGGTFDADMEVIIVAIHRSDLGEPAAVALGFAAQRFLDRGIDEDALHARLLRGVTDHHEMPRRPDGRIDVETVGAYHHDRGHLLALLAR